MVRLSATKQPTCLPTLRAFADTTITVGADKNYDTVGFLQASCDAARCANDGCAGGSAIYGRAATRWAGYAISQRKRKCIEQVLVAARQLAGFGKQRFAAVNGLNRYSC
jgi:hypothetical protein